MVQLILVIAEDRASQEGFDVVSEGGGGRETMDAARRGEDEIVIDPKDPILVDTAHTGHEGYPGEGIRSAGRGPRNPMDTEAIRPLEDDQLILVRDDRRDPVAVIGVNIDAS